MNEDIKRTTLCQCTKCGTVKEYKGDMPICSQCGGKLHFIRLSNCADEAYLEKISLRFNDQ